MKTDWNHLVERESVRVEWKENVANPQNVVKTLSAFANDFRQVGGGRVICGLKEEKNESGKPVAVVVGLDEKRFREIKNKVLDSCHRYVDPPITPGVSEYPVPNDSSRRILVFSVTSSQYAHRYRTKKEDVNYYVRINDETRTANGLIPQLLERKKVWPPYLDQTHPDSSLDAVNTLVLKEFLSRKKLLHPVEKYLEPKVRLRGDIECLVTHPPGRTDRIVPRNFTILLFGREPHHFFRGAYAIFSVYHGHDKSVPHSQRFVIHGPIPELIRNLMARLQMYMGMNIDTNQPFGSNKINNHRYSEQAVKEAIVNAFVHRDYHSHEPVRVVVFEDKITVINPGGPYALIGVEDIRNGNVTTAWRNPSLAWFMVELEYAQNEGQGIRKIVNLTKENSGKEPEFWIKNEWFQVSIPAYNSLLVNQMLKQENNRETNVSIEFNLTRNLPEMQDGFREFKKELERSEIKFPELSEELKEIEDSLSELTLIAGKKELVKPMNKLGSFLRSLGDDDSTLSKVIGGTQKGIDLIQKVYLNYNKFAQWLALPQVPDALPGEGDKKR
ncbi:MAG: hypothetical protein GY940_38345 [bacterium]|nr:hypothetical protein [bacterium]